MANAVHICGPSATHLRKRVLSCPTCECFTEMAVQFPGHWFGPPTATCCRCGDEFAPSGHRIRDSEDDDPSRSAAYRADAVSCAQEMWNIATHAPSPNHYELEPRFCHDDPEEETCRPMTISLKLP